MESEHLELFPSDSNSGQSNTHHQFEHPSVRTHFTSDASSLNRTGLLGSNGNWRCSNMFDFGGGSNESCSNCVVDIQVWCDATQIENLPQVYVLHKF